MPPAIDSNGVATVNPPTRLCRVGRDTAPVAFSYITPDVDKKGDRGYRFDVLGAGVMYAATEPIGAYTETVQQYQVDATTAAWVKKSQPGLMVNGNLPYDWREHRRIVSFTLNVSLPFLDIEATQNHTALTSHLAGDLAGLGVAKLDVSVVRSNQRLVTRLIAMWAYLQEDKTTGAKQYAGIRFMSKLGGHECWAIFEGAPISDIETSLIDLDELHQACEPLGVWAH